MDLNKTSSIVGAVLAAVGGTLALSSCDEDGPADPESTGAGSKPVCVTTSWPLQSLLAEIAGDAMEVHCLLPFDRDVRGWAPPRDVLQELADADLICLQGAGLERWAVRASLPRDRRVQLAAPFRDQWLRIERAVTHRHGQGDLHTHQGLDPHVWFVPRLVGLMARAFGDAAQGVRPERRDEIEQRTRSVLERLEQIEAEFVRAEARLRGLRVVADHPSFGYLADRFGWDYVELHEDTASLGPVDLVLTEPGVDEGALLDRLRAAGGELAPILVIDPGARCALAGEPFALLSWLGELPEKIEQALQ
ncbi:MAG: metal ABC transporter substrate-binding protein [Planctomycetota bacterium]